MSPAAMSPLLVVDAAALDEGLALVGRTSHLGAFDAVLVATAHRAGADVVVSADRAFGEGPVRWSDPGRPGFVDGFR